MAISYHELVASQAVVDRPGSPSVSREWILLGSADVDEIRLKVIEIAGPLYLTLWLVGVTVDPLGPGIWKGTAEYGIPELTPGTELPSQISNDGSNPGGPGADGGNPPQEPSDEAPIGPEYSFSTIGGTERIMHARDVKFYGAAPGRLPLTNTAISPDQDGNPQGIDIPSRKLELTTTRRVAAISMRYVRLLADLTGTINDRKWFGFEPGSARFDGSEGQYRDQEGWSVTYRFVIAKGSPKDTIVTHSPEMKLSAYKRGWDLLEVGYEQVKSETGLGMSLTPFCYRVLEVMESANFKKIGIGG